MLDGQRSCWHRRNCDRLGAIRIMIRIRFPEREWWKFFIVGGDAAAAVTLFASEYISLCPGISSVD
jgi:hypothetical protein